MDAHRKDTFTSFFWNYFRYRMVGDKPKLQGNFFPLSSSCAAGTSIKGGFGNVHATHWVLFKDPLVDPWGVLPGGLDARCVLICSMVIPTNFRL